LTLNNQTHWNKEDLKNLSEKWKNIKLKNRINSDALHQLDQANLVAKNCKNLQSEITAELSDPELPGALLNSVHSFVKNEKEGIVTAVVAKARYQQATENQTQQKLKQSARSCPSNTIIKVLLDSEVEGS
jgi:hypothetical protein